MKFRDWGLDENLLKGIEEAGYAECMPVQEHTLEKTLKKQDVLVQSQTGSGKTAAFIISVFQLFLEARPEKRCKALAIVPTRELAVQIEEEALLLSKYLDFKIASFYGGVGYEKQEKLLREGVDIIVGTPGRLIDLSDSKKLNFYDVDILIIDEADRLFDMGFLPDIMKMLRKMKKREDRHTMLFSATMNLKVRQVAWEHMNEPADITLNPETVTVESISQEIYHVGRLEKINLLIGLLKKINPNSSLVFTNTKQAAYEVSQRLEMNGFKSRYIIGDLPQPKRLKTIDDMKSGKVPILVATDVAARGLHIDNLELVVNYDIPEDCENYVHRIGRTARAGKSGKAISLACERYVYGLDAIESYIDMKIPVVWADDDLFEEDASRGRYFNLEKNKKHAQPDDRDTRRGARGHGGKTSRRTPIKSREGLPENAVGAAKHRGGKAQTFEAASLKKQQRNGATQPVEAGKYQTSKVTTRLTTPRSIRRGSLEKRVKYYSEKYGENFSVPAEQHNKKRKDSLLGKIKGLFKNK